MAADLLVDIVPDVVELDVLGRELAVDEEGREEADGEDGDQEGEDLRAERGEMRHDSNSNGDMAGWDSDLTSS